jgi:hypothetical protein
MLEGPMTTNAGKGVPTLFLCWSGPRSKLVAEALAEYFESLFKALGCSKSDARVAMSETLIAKGAPWSAQLLKDLENARAGIVCLTPENRGSAWLHFEGGAIATRGLTGGKRSVKKQDPTNQLFGFLFTFDNTQLDGPLSLFQATVYRRDYSRDRDELERLTRAVLGGWKKLTDPHKTARLPERPLDTLMGRLRELHSVAFREILPALEGHARPIIQALDNPSTLTAQVQGLSAILSLEQLLQDRERQIELLCASSQQMFFERLIEALSVSRRALETTIGEASAKTFDRFEETARKLRRMLEASVEPLTPVLDDAWRYALYGVPGKSAEAYRKKKLLLVHPLESTLQRAEVAARRDVSRGKASDETVPPGHQLSRNEKRRALRSYWPWDRIAAYIHYCEDVSQPSKEELTTALIDLTRGVLKEMSLLEVMPEKGSNEAIDDLPLRFAVRALVLKVKLAIAYGRYGVKKPKALLKSGVVREVIEGRILGETGLSFPGVAEFITCLRQLNDRIWGAGSPDSPLLSLIADLDRLLAICSAPTPLTQPIKSVGWRSRSARVARQERHSRRP